jgi:hypothetical protein
LISTVAPVSGWILDYIVALDSKLPGFAGAYFRASDERRQVIATYLATRASDETEGGEFAAAAAQFLMRAQHRDILAKAFKTVPEGLRGALARSGPQPHKPRFYGLLQEMLSTPSHDRVIPTIRHISALDLTKLRVIRQLPPEVCNPSIVQALDNVGPAADLAKVITLFAEAGLDRLAMTSAFDRVTCENALRKTIKRWALKTVLPAHPVAPSDSYRPISTSAQLQETGRRFRNCMSQYISSALDGIDALALFKPGLSKRGMIVHLQRRDEVWIIEGLFGPQNSRPDPELHREGTAYLESHGVSKRPREQTPTGPWAALGRFTSPYLFGDYGL